MQKKLVCSIPFEKNIRRWQLIVSSRLVVCNCVLLALTENGGVAAIQYECRKSAKVLLALICNFTTHLYCYFFLDQTDILQKNNLGLRDI